jgi:outer membrane protein TolC
MRKLLCTSLVLLLILSGVTAAFAAEANKDTTVAASTEAAAPKTTGAAVTTDSDSETTGAAVTIIPDMTFTGDPIKLSLEGANKKMLSDSPGAEFAGVNKKNAEAYAKGYAETIGNIEKAEDAEAGGAIIWTLDTSSKPMLEANKKFASEQGPRNYDAEINALKRKTIDNYYKLKEIENQVKIAKDNLALKEKLYSNTQLKFKLGTVSKSDLLKAEISVNTAKDLLLTAQNGLNTMKMGFNQFMGYGLMQNVTLTDEIKEIPLPKKALADTIKSGLTNRNEIYGAKYNLEMATLTLNTYKAYPRSSSKYIKANNGVLLAEVDIKNAPLSIESDVRAKYMAMYEKYSAVQTGKKSVENAKETERLAQLQYDAGMSTLSDVEGAQLAYYEAQLSYSKALLEYNLAVYDYELAGTVGTETVKIQ